MKYIEYEKNINKEKPFEIVIGKKEDGSNYKLDLCEAPHILIAGTTGSGKSTLMNNIMLSIINNNDSNDVKFLLVDCKMVEYSHLSDSKYLYCPIIYDEKKALEILDEIYEEMERRYSLLSEKKTRNIKDYNKISDEKLPYIFVIFDETNFYGFEEYEFIDKITKIVQKSRASGIHFILGTQRPSFASVSNNLSSNIPTRICLRVVSYADSRMMLGQSGAENLETRGWALVKNNCGKIEKVLTYYVNEREFEKYLVNKY